MSGAVLLYVSSIVIVLTALVHDEGKRDEPLGVVSCVWIAMLWLPFLVACIVRREVADPDRRR